ncbi:E3 ubiquitin-protein ligase XIAP [Mizuhopecten yessoensis]|uniref:E3 ubiquitin-protein ligase XIAP n=2 Tax=Mizuhopecten yessoensis TaxID=6573 RepID=A0A210QUC1_MIZYE|nr:E3 ubiquitin-protein ligase XIAP [Mizuhopecten yessoensis]
MMSYRKSTLGIFLACIGLFSGYVIRRDSLKSFRNGRSHDLDTFNPSHDLTRKSVLVDTTPDEYIELVLLMQVDFNDTFVPCQIITFYRFISVLINQFSSFGFSSRNEHQKTKQNPDSCTSHITEIETTSEWIHGRKRAIHVSRQRANENANHSDDFSTDNGTRQTLQIPYFKLDHVALELKTGIKLSVTLFFILTRIFWMILRNVPRHFDKTGARAVKGDTPNSTYHWGLLKYFLESSNSFIDSVTTKSCSSMKKVLEDTMSTLSPPPQDIVVAPVTELNDYFETTSHMDTSNIDISLNIEILRIESFRNFSRSAPVSTIRLAENGFFYTGKSDEVECFHCHVRYSGWSRGDTPFDIHKKTSPDCDFVRGMETVNVPLLQPSRKNSNKEDGTTCERACTRDVCGPPEMGNDAKVSDYQFRSKPSSDKLHSNAVSIESQIISYRNTIENERHSNASVPASHSNTDDIALHIINGGKRNQASEEGRVFENEAGGKEGGNLKNLQHSECIGRRQEKNALTGKEDVKITYLDENNTNQTDWRTKYSGKLRLAPLAYVRKSLMYPAYAIPTIRLSSYKGWSTTSGHNPRSLSDAGFIYAGYGDLVRCFCCGGALRNWLPGDDPWIEHARWFPECVYLRQSKGDNFILLVHDDVTLPQMSSHNKSITPQSATGEADSSPVPENARHFSPDPVDQSVEDPFTQRVKAMGFSMDTILSGVTSLQRQGKPIDAFNIINEILCSEIIPERVGLDDIDSFQKKQQTVRRNNRQVQGAEKPILRTKNKCKICLGEDACVMFLPCQHVICCNECGPVLYKCPVCRQVIKDRLETQ